MDIEASGRIVNPREFSGVSFGAGVVLYGDVRICAGTRVGDYCIIGVPAIEDMDCEGTPPTTCIGPGVTIGSHCVVKNGARIGKRTVLDNYCEVGAESSIGDDTKVIYRSQIHWRVEVGRSCIVGGFCCDRSIVNDNVIMLGNLVHKLANPDILRWDEIDEPSPVLMENAIIGLGAIVVGGVTIYPRARVAAGAIVTRDVQSGKIIVGVNQEKRKKDN